MIATGLRGVMFLLRLEIQMYVGLLRLVTRRADVPAGSASYSYAGAVAALLWGFTGVSAVELVVLHLIIPWEPVRLVADIVGIWGLVWVAGMTGCHYVYPHLTAADVLRVRNVHRTDVVTVPWDAVGSVASRERGRDSSRGLQVEERAAHDGGTLLHVTVGSRTNVEVRLTRPVTVRHRGHELAVTEVRLFADDPRDLLAAIRTASDA